MRILHVVPSYLPAWRYGGPIRSVHGLARAQSGLGGEVDVFTTDADGPGRLDVETGVRVDVDGVGVWYFRCVWPRRLYRSTPLAEAIRRRIHEYDVVHLHSVFLWPTLVAARAAERTAIPYFVSPRGMLVDHLIAERGAIRKRAWIRLFERRTLGRATGILLQSELERRELENLGLDLAPLHVVFNGVDLGEIEDPSALPRWLEALVANPYILHLGRISWKKGVERLIRALERIEDLNLVVAGNDDEQLTPKLKRLAAESGLAHRIVFVGEVRGAEKWLLLRHASAFCLASTSENFGIAAVEAMAVGTPTIVTPEVGLASEEKIRPGLIVASGDPESLAEAIRETLEDTPKLTRLREISRRIVREELSWPSIAAAVCRLYAEGLQGRASIADS